MAMRPWRRTVIRITIRIALASLLLALAVALAGCGGAPASADAPAGTRPSITWPFVELPDGRIISMLCH